jgi:hypothetical protein
MPSRFTCDRTVVSVQRCARLGCTRRGDAKPDARTILNAGRYPQPDVVTYGAIANAGTRRTPVAPDFAAPATLGTDRPDRKVNRHRRAPKRFLWGEDDFGPTRGGGCIAEKRLTHAIEQRVHGREINRNLVSETVDRLGGQLIPGNVRVIPLGQLPVRAFDFLCAGIRRNTKHVVVIPHLPSHFALPWSSIVVSVLGFRPAPVPLAAITRLRCRNDAAAITSSQD